MKYALGGLGVIAAAVLLLVSGAMNWQFGYSLGKTELDSQIFGLASAASDGLKALLPFFLFAAIRTKQWSQAAAGATLWLVCLAFSLTSALGFASLNRADTTGARAAQVVNYQDLRTDLSRARERLGWIPEHRPAGSVSSEIESMKQQRRWRATSGCTDATARKSITFCQEFHRLNAELSSAQEAVQIEQKIAAIQAQLAIVPKDLAQTKADPQADVLAALTGLKLEDVQTALVILVAILVELGSALGFYVVLGNWNVDERRNPVVVSRPRTRETANDNKSPASSVAVIAEATARPTPKLVAPQNDIERFFKERVSEAEGCSLTATALYEDYCEWCDEHEKEPLALPTFGRQFGEQGVHKAKIAGRIRYIGIKLISETRNEGGSTENSVAA